MHRKYVISNRECVVRWRVSLQSWRLVGGQWRFLTIRGEGPQSPVPGSATDCVASTPCSEGRRGWLS